MYVPHGASNDVCVQLAVAEELWDVCPRSLLAAVASVVVVVLLFAFVVLIAATCTRSAAVASSGSLAAGVNELCRSPDTRPSALATVAESSSFTKPWLMMPVLCALIPTALRLTPSPRSTSALPDCLTMLSEFTPAMVTAGQGCALPKNSGAQRHTSDPVSTRTAEIWKRPVGKW